MEWVKKNDELTTEYIKNNIEHNAYYEYIKAEYENSVEEEKEKIIYNIYNCYEDMFDSYYSLYTIMDSIEDYMSENRTSVAETITRDDFTIKRR